MTYESVECGDCGKYKKQSFTWQRDKESFLLLDEKHREWNGTQCPDCRTGVVPVAVPKFKAARFCRGCSTTLGVNHFYCNDCLETQTSGLHLEDNHVYD